MKILPQKKRHQQGLGLELEGEHIGHLHIISETKVESAPVFCWKI